MQIMTMREEGRYVEDDVAVTAVEATVILLGDRDDLELLNAPDPETGLGTDAGLLSPGLLECAFLFAVLLLEFAAKLGQVGLLELYLNGEVKP